MENEFTKGEWRVYLSNTSYADVVVDGSDDICTCWSGYVGEDEAKANAKLIAAAPDMLEALLETDKDLCVLESTMAQIESTDPRAEGMTELVKKWRERNKLAIKKATE